MANRSDFFNAKLPRQWKRILAMGQTYGWNGDAHERGEIRCHVFVGSIEGDVQGAPVRSVRKRQHPSRSQIQSEFLVSRGRSLLSAKGAGPKVGI